MTMPTRLNCRFCPVCGGRRTEWLHTIAYERFFETLPDRYDIVACLDCGMVFNDTTACEADFDRYYTASSKYEGAGIIGAGDVSPTERERYGRIIRFMEPYLAKNDFIVDAGCGQGGFLQILRESGYSRLLGIDPSVSNIAALCAGGIPARAGTLKQLPEFGQCDFLLLIGVMEHLFDPVSAMKSISEHCRDGAYVLIAVPSTRDYGMTINTSFYHFDFEHISHFDLHQLNNLMIPLGYELATHGYDFVSVKDVRNDVLLALYRKQGKAGKIVYDAVASDRVKIYVDESRQHDFGDITEQLQRDGQELYLWGCGAHLARLLRETPLGQCRIAAFVDNSIEKQSRPLLGRPVIPSRKLHTLGKDSIVAVCSPLYRTVMHEELENAGFKGKVIDLC